MSIFNFKVEGKSGKKITKTYDKMHLESNIAKAIASLVVCLLGGFSMYITGGETGIGWAILGLLIIWG